MESDKLLDALTEMEELSQYCNIFNQFCTPENYKLVNELNPKMIENIQMVTIPQNLILNKNVINIKPILGFGGDLNNCVKIIISLVHMVNMPFYNNFVKPSISIINVKQCQFLLDNHSKIINVTFDKMQEINALLTEFNSIREKESHKCSGHDFYVYIDDNSLKFKFISVKINGEFKSIGFDDVHHYIRYILIYSTFDKCLDKIFQYDFTMSRQLKNKILKLFHNYADKKNRLKYIREIYGSEEEIYDALDKIYKEKN